LNGKEKHMTIKKAKPSERVFKISGEVIDLMRKADLLPDEVMNIMLNILAQSAVITCLPKDELVEALIMAYDLHLTEHGKNETLN
jgi:hypothetical protein